MSTDSSASTKPRAALFALFFSLLLVGVAAGIAASSYRLVPSGGMEFIRPVLMVVAFLPIWALAVGLFIRRRRQAKQRVLFR